MIRLSRGQPQPLMAAEKATNSRYQNRKLERLRQIVISARRKAAKHIFGLAPRGEHQGGDELVRLAQL